ncbi:hypothetical protein [Thauera sp. Sel9]|uniref:hypothetical protein n=1 Tax=Thauera sp. Sel9 TaxID=2974299 RepID=UPI0021E123A8|nr:hypothetical protein [Thauera sp. Sel9]MCV2216220.1 hypothetical protein [Thauera sp. Sel9]
MKRLFWFLVGVMISAVPMLAFADEYPASWGYGNGYVVGAAVRLNTGFILPTVDAACTTGATPQVGTQPFESLPHRNWKCMNPATGSVSSVYLVQQQLVCPYGGSLDSSNGYSNKLCRNAPSCPNGQTRKPDTGQCQADPCSHLGGENASGRFDMAYAYTNSPNSEIFGVREVPQRGCSGADRCGWRPSNNPVPGSCTVSQTGGPPYTVSCAYEGAYDGGQCSTSETSDSQSPMPPRGCPAGSVAGEVNGVAGCYGSYGSTEEKTETTAPDGTKTTTETKTNPDGSKTTTTTTTHPDGSTTTTKETIQSTSPLGESMPGSSSGGSSGGSGGAGGSGGGGGAGRGDRGDTEQANFCRDNPNSLMCKDRVKIDETGTPEALDGANINQSLDEQFTTIIEMVQGTSWHRTELGFTWNLPDKLPAGTCGAVGIGGTSFDICPTLEKARALWAWVLGVLGALAIWIRGTNILAKV